MGRLSQLVTSRIGTAVDETNLHSGGTQAVQKGSLQRCQFLSRGRAIVRGQHGVSGHRVANGTGLDRQDGLASQLTQQRLMHKIEQSELV